MCYIYICKHVYMCYIYIYMLNILILFFLFSLIFYGIFKKLLGNQIFVGVPSVCYLENCFHFKRWTLHVS